MKQLLKIFRMAFSYKFHTFMVILYNLFFVIFNLLSLVLFIPFLQIIFGDNKVNEMPCPPSRGDYNIFEYASEYYDYQMQVYVFETGAEKALLFVCISVALAFLLKNIFRYLAIFHLSYLRMAVVRDLRKEIFDKILRLPISFFSEEKKGDLMSRMTNDVNEIEISIVSSLELLFREPVNILLHIGILIYWSPQLTLFSMILLPISAFAISRIGKSLKRTAVKGQNQLGQLNANIEEVLGGLKILIGFNAQKSAKKHFYSHNDNHRRLITRAFRKRDLSSPLNEVLGSFVLLSIVWFGGKLILAEDTGMTASQFLGFIIVFSQLLRPVQSIANASANLSKGKASIDRIDKILNAEETIKNPTNPIKKSQFDSEITFHNVSFAYSKEKVLKDIDLTFKKGTMSALVGQSGSGKSTLADLIPRFYDVKEGSITIDGKDVKDLDIESLRSMIGIVTQESILFNETVANNIALGMEDPNRESIIEAAKVANAHDFIMKLPEGYDTNIGDRGMKLSGGQRQRVCIARAVLKNPPILILDEATSALDTESEKLVQDALEKLMKNRTSVVIAHRLSTIVNSDQIFVMDNGQIIEQGTHEELIQNKGAYYNYSLVQNI